MKIRFVFLVVTVLAGIRSSKAKPQLISSESTTQTPTDPRPTTQQPTIPPPTVGPLLTETPKDPPPTTKQLTNPPSTNLPSTIQTLTTPPIITRQPTIPSFTNTPHKPSTLPVTSPPTVPPNHSTSPAHVCTCPETCDGIAADLNDEYIVNVIKNKAVNVMWGSQEPELKGDEMKMKEIVLRMSNSDSKIWQENAFVNSIWLWNLLPYASDNPSLCPFAEMLEATLAWNRMRDSKAVADAIDKIADVLLEAARAAGNTALEKAGCPTLSRNKFKEHRCPENGKMYPVDELWKLSEDKYPCAYESAAKVLYKSEMNSSQLMSIMATCSISQPFQDFTEHFDNRLIYQLGLLRISDRIPSCCCKKRSKKVMNLFHRMKNETEHAASLAKAKYFRVTVLDRD